MDPSAMGVPRPAEPAWPYQSDGVAGRLGGGVQGGGGADAEGAESLENAEHHVRRVELEGTGGEVDAAGRAVVVVLEELTERQKIEGQRVPGRVRRAEVPVAVAV